MNEIIKEDIDIKNLIYEIRGVEVMIDADLARLYQVETKRINEAVKNNPKKFPERFSFTISDLEKNNLWSKFSTANISSKSRSNPRVFTEQGIYMLATILRSKVATEVSIAIMDTFVKMRHYINYTKSFLPHKILLLEDKVNSNTKKINELFDKFDPKVIVNHCLFFEGELYDAYSKVQEIFKLAKKELMVIDGFADNSVLDIIRRLNVKVTLIVKPKRLLSKQDVERYNMQYHNLKVIFDDTFHDRYFIIDKKTVYHCGTSINKIGARTFSMTKINDEEINKQLIDKVERIIKKNED